MYTGFTVLKKLFFQEDGLMLNNLARHLTDMKGKMEWFMASCLLWISFQKALLKQIRCLHWGFFIYECLRMLLQMSSQKTKIFPRLLFRDIEIDDTWKYASEHCESHL